MLRTVLCRRAALAAAHRPAGRTLPAVPALAERANVAPRTQPSRTRALSSTPAARLASTAATASGSGSGGKASAVAAAQDASLRVEVPTQAAGTVGDLLKSHLEKQPGAPASDYLVAFADDSTHALSMLDDVPAGASSLHYHTFDSHPAARDAFWRSAAFLLAASLAHQDPQIRIASPPTLQTAGSGGDGFALSWLPAQEADSAPAAGQASSSASGPLEAAAELANSQPTAKPLSPEQLQQVAGAAMKAAGLNMRFEYVSLSREAAAKELGANALKLEQLATLPDEEVRLVRLGVYVDICPPPGQPLLPDTRTLKRALQLVDCSVASWVPQLPTAPKSFTSSSQCLLHVRGIAFPKKPQLAAHLAAVAAAARESDHREIGKAQRLFMTNPASPGTPFILPHGTRLGRKVERVVRDLYDVWGYDEVITPQLMRKSLWQTSGHWENYRADMFGVRGFVDVDAPSEPLASVVSSAVAEERKGCCAAHDTPAETAAQDEFGLKPMNCPGHCLIFADEERSYRVLPLRLAEFSPLHRNESSGSLSGLTRVRRFHQDDAHVFCRPDQVSAEITSMLTMLAAAYRTFGFSSFELVLSTRPAKYIGDIAVWDAAENDLRAALDSSGAEWALNEGDGAFYGPKIDVRLVDALGRKHQTATIQLDFQLPERFSLSYKDPKAPDGRARPVMIHRAILGSLERFMAILIESCKGQWPFWISPRQAIVMPTQPDNEEQLAHAQRVRNHLSLGPEAARYIPIVTNSTGILTASPDAERPPRPTQVFHVDLETSKDRLGKRVLRALKERYNFVLIIGDEEVANGTVRVRARESAVAEGEGRPKIEEDMGEWKVADLRALMCTLDAHHW